MSVGEPQMGQLIPFVPRPVGGDWTAAERDRLGELARKLEAQGAHVDATHGVSDAGDPWCVITDDQGEVLVHVARIDGRFVVHDAAADVVQAGDTLWSAFTRLLGDTWSGDRQDGVVVPLREAQSILALVTVLVFLSEVAAGHADLSVPAHSTAPTHDDTGPVVAALSAAAAPAPSAAHATAPAAPEDGGPRRQALLTQADLARVHVSDGSALPLATGSTGSGSSATPTTTPSSTLADLGAVRVLIADDTGVTLRGGSGPELLIGGRGGDHLIGGDGNDTLVGGGAPVGQIDVLEGGAGDDRLIMAARTVAIGGPGHDVFVVTAKPQPPALVQPLEQGTPPTPPTDSGVILDFTNQDRLEFAKGVVAKVVSVTPEADVLAGLHNDTALSQIAATPGVQVGLDLDGDGKADVYLTVAGSGATALVQGWTSTSAADHVTVTDPHLDPGALSHPPGGFLLG